MLPMRGTLAALALALALTPLAVAQDHGHGMGQAMVVIAHDSDPEGRAVVGNVAHFAAILFDADGKPAFHHNLEIHVTLNGQDLFATTGASGHDYDGVNGFDVVFPVPGAYVVTAATEDEQGNPLVGAFRGTVVAPTAPVAAALDLQGPDSVIAYEPATFTYQVNGPAGQLLPHTDAVFEVRRLADAAVVFRVHTHTHMAPMELQYAFTRPGEYAVSILAYTAFPTATSQDFPAFTTTRTVRVAPGPAVLPLAPPEVPMVNANRNDVTVGESNAPDVAILGTYDPYTLVGPHSQARLSTVVADTTTMEPVPHINFDAALTDSFGRTLFQSSTLHEYDGVFELLAGGQDPGQYHLQVNGAKGPWEGRIAHTYTVAPPVAAQSLGPQFVQVSGLDGVASGEAITGEVFVHDLAGMPFAHGEVDLQVLPAAEGAAPILATKLHTHGDGRFPFNLTLPVPGDYVLRLAPFSLEARPTPVFFGPGPGDPVDHAFTASAGRPFPETEPLGATADEVPRATPGPEAALAAVALGALALARRRR